MFGRMEGKRGPNASLPVTVPGSCSSIDLSQRARDLWEEKHDPSASTPIPIRRKECETACAVLVINAWFCFHLVFQDSVDSAAAGVFLVGF